MNNFISLLDTTLHMNNVKDEEDSDEGQVEELLPVEEEPGAGDSPASAPPSPPPHHHHPQDDPQPMHHSVSMPSMS